MDPKSVVSHMYWKNGEKIKVLHYDKNEIICVVPGIQVLNNSDLKKTAFNNHFIQNNLKSALKIQSKDQVILTLLMLLPKLCCKR